jgi:hypothetical protein
MISRRTDIENPHRTTEGLIRGLKSRNIKTVPVVDFMLTDCG